MHCQHVVLVIRTMETVWEMGKSVTPTLNVPDRQTSHGGGPVTPLWHKVAINMLLHWRLFQGNRAIGEIIKSKKWWFLRKWLPKLHYDELAIGLLDFFHFSLNGCWQLHPHTSFIHYFNHNSHVSQFSFNSMKAFACFLLFLGRNSLFSHCIVTQNPLAMAFWLIIVMGCNHESYNRFLPKLHLNELLDQCIWSKKSNELIFVCPSVFSGPLPEPFFSREAEDQVCNIYVAHCSKD